MRIRFELRTFEPLGAKPLLDVGERLGADRLRRLAERLLLFRVDHRIEQLVHPSGQIK